MKRHFCTKNGYNESDIYALARRHYGADALVSWPGDLTVPSGRVAVALVAARRSGPWALVTVKGDV
jgi:hypothetical protein